MKVTAPIKLITTPEQRAILLATMERVNDVCNWLSKRAFELKEFRSFSLHRLVYHEARALFPLKSQHICRALAKVCHAYARGPQTKQVVFKRRGMVSYDPRNSYGVSATRVSMQAQSGKRLRLPYACGPYQRKLLEGKHGQADLVYAHGQFYLHIWVDAIIEHLHPSKGFLGVDLGINTIAADSDGVLYSGAAVRRKRERIYALRSALQSCGTRSAKRHLKRLSGQVRNFNTHTNHEISKALVSKAKGTGRGIAVENLTGITHRVTVRKAQRAVLHQWTFYKLKQYIAYKALRAGVELRQVNPAYTSQTCPECGCVSRKNRPSQAVFLCIKCGYEAHADFVGARNIATKALVGGPIVTGVDTQVRVEPSCKLP